MEQDDGRPFALEVVPDRHPSSTNSGRMNSSNVSRSQLATVTGVSARSRSASRPVDISGFRWFDDPTELATSPDNDVFVELIGGQFEIICALVRDAVLKLAI